MIDRLAAPQRTALAWSRTGLSAATLAGTAVKTAAEHADTITLCCAVITSLAAVGFFVCGQRRASYETGARTPAALLFRVAVLCALAAVLAGTVLVALPHP